MSNLKHCEIKTKQVMEAVDDGFIKAFKAKFPGYDQINAKYICTEIIKLFFERYSTLFDDEGRSYLFPKLNKATQRMLGI
jgi:hypothetical protein